MHQNYYFLKQLALRLNDVLHQARLEQAFSQDKGELVLGFEQADRSNFFIRASLLPEFTALDFPKDFQRARKNSASLFQALKGLAVKEVAVFPNDRSLGITFSNDDCLVFKLHGSRSNVMLFDGYGKLVELLKKNMKGDSALSPKTLGKVRDQSKEAFMASGGDYRSMFPALGARAIALVEKRLASLRNPEEKWTQLESVIMELESGRFHLLTENGMLSLTLLADGEVLTSFDDPIEAMREFYKAYKQIDQFAKARATALRELSKKISVGEKYIQSKSLRLMELGDGTRNEQLANVLMANLNEARPGLEVIRLFDFYLNKEIDLPLKQNLSLQKNAEILYRKAKNAKIEINRIEENINAREAENKELALRKIKIGQTDDPKEIRRLSGTRDTAKNPASTLAEGPFKSEIYQGYQILIGKNAKGNDQLTKMAHKDDLWLHARNVAGSHVIVRWQPGKEFPKAVVERAAALAAWHSKSRGEGLSPVIVTKKKFVRKPKGVEAGKVQVEKESVIMVKPTA